LLSLSCELVLLNIFQWKLFSKDDSLEVCTFSLVFALVF
jgi:hypothetical protein